MLSRHLCIPVAGVDASASRCEQDTVHLVVCNEGPPQTVNAWLIIAIGAYMTLSCSLDWIEPNGLTVR